MINIDLQKAGKNLCLSKYAHFNHFPIFMKKQNDKKDTTTRSE